VNVLYSTSLGLCHHVFMSYSIVNMYVKYVQLDNLMYICVGGASLTSLRGRAGGSSKQATPALAQVH